MVLNKIMETRKRRWKSSPDKKTARASLDFAHVENTPPRKRRALASLGNSSENSSDADVGIDEDSFNTKSFYGGKEKKHFPHSPGRRKKAVKILSKITANKKEPESPVWQTFKEFKKSLPQQPVSPEQNVPSLRTRKTRVLVTSNNKTTKSPAKVKAPKEVSENAATPASKNKFFKHRSPASADKAVGSVIIRKGFDLKFTPRHSANKVEKQKKTPKGKSIKKLSTERKPTFNRPIVKHTNTEIERALNNKTATEDSAFFSENSAEIPTASSPKSASLISDIGEGSMDLFSSEVASDSSPSKASSICSGPTRRSQTTADTPSSSSVSSSPAGKKYFSIFDSQRSTPKSSPQIDRLKGKSGSSRRSPRTISRVNYYQEDDKDQLILDAGQKKFGATQCDVCGMVYSHANPTDEATHDKFHQNLMNALKFAGWKKERVVQEYPLDGSRVIMVQHNDPKYAIRKVEEINEVMGQELGFPEPSLAFRMHYKAFLYISEEKRIEGCCVAEPVTEGYRVIADSQPSQSSQPGHRPWCCQSTPEPAAVGISRIWVYGQQRRKGVATKLLDSVRQWFEYGVFIEKEKMAFSDPTPDGKQLATRYTGTPAFLVYKYTT